MRASSRRLAAVAVAAALGTGVLGAGVPAEATATRYVNMTWGPFGCGKGGFTGKVKIWYRYYGASAPFGKREYLTKVQYRITPKAGNAGRRHNDVFVYDRDVSAKNVLARTGDAAISDNKWHGMKIVDRWSSGVQDRARFIFDLKDHKDPSCVN